MPIARLNETLNQLVCVNLLLEKHESTFLSFLTPNEVLYMFRIVAVLASDRFSD